MLTAEVDGRTISGAKQALKRMTAPKKTKSGLLEAPVNCPKVARLKNFMKVVEAAVQLQPASIPSLSRDEYDGIVALVHKEKPEYPLLVQTAMVKRRLLELSAKRDYTAFVESINPWQELTFDPFVCKLGGLSCTVTEKMVVYCEVVFKEVLVNEINKGQDSATTMLSILDLLICLMSEVDTVTLSHEDATILEECNETCLALHSVVGDSLDPDREAFASVIVHVLGPPPGIARP